MDRVLELVQVLAKDAVLERVAASLLGSQVQNGTTYLEQVFGNIFRLTAKLPRIRINVKILPLLLKKSVDLQRLLHYALLTDEIQLVEHIDEIYLIWLLNLLLDDLAELRVKLLH